MSDLMREKFEVWVKKRAISGPFGFHPQLLNRCKLDPDRYAVSWVDSAFEGWQASREYLVIELPERGPSFTVAGVTSFSLKNEGRNEAIKEIEVSIHEVGVKTK